MVDDSHFSMSDHSLLQVSTAQSLQLVIPFITSAIKRSSYASHLFDNILNIPFDESHLVAVETLRSLLLKSALNGKANQLSSVLSKDSKIRGSCCYVVFILSAFPMDKELAVVLIESCCERRVVNGVADFSD